MNRSKLLAAVAVLAMVFAGAAVVFSDSNTDAADTNITYIRGEINADQIYGKGTVVVVDGNLKIVNGAKLTIGDGAKFTVNEGVTLTVGQLNNKASMEISYNADVDIKGSLVIGENGSLSMTEKPKDTTSTGKMTISSSIAIKNGGEFNLGGNNVYVSTGASVDVTSLGAKVSKIGNGTINLAPNASFNLLGAIHDGNINYLIIKSDDGVKNENTVVSKAQVILTGDGTKDNLTAANVSNVKITSSMDTATAYQDGNRKTVKVYNLDVSGTIQNDDIMDIVGSSERVLYNKATAGEPITFKDKVTVSSNLVIKTGKLTINNDAYLLVSGTTNVMDNGEFGYSGGVPSSESKSGIVEITGTSTMSLGSFVKNGVKGFMIINGGTSTITNCNSFNEVPTLEGFYGAFYFVADASGKSNLVMCDLKDAIDASTENNTITQAWVFNAFSGKYYVIAEDIEIPAFFNLNVMGYVTIPAGVTVTVDSDALFFIDNDNGLVEVEGKLIDKTYSLTSTPDNQNGFVSSDVVIDDEENATRTFTSLEVALSESSDGQIIVLCRPITIDSNMTIPTGITVVAFDDAEAIKISKDVTLTIDGVLELRDKSTIKSTDGFIVLNNMIKNAGKGDINGLTIAGAYFDAKIGDDSSLVSYITSVPVAAENSAATDSITIEGKVSFGDVTFTDGESATVLEVVFAEKSETAAGVITTVGATIIVKDKFSGKIAASVSESDVLMTFIKAYGFSVVIDSYNDGQTITTSAQISGINDVKDGKDRSKLYGTATIDEGAVTIVSEKELVVENLTVSDGAEAIVSTTLMVDTDLEDITKFPIDINSVAEKYAGLVVDGKMTISKKLTWGPVVVNGELIADEKSDISVDILSVNGKMIFNEGALGTTEYIAVNGSISGQFKAGILIAFPGSDVSGAEMNMNGDETLAKSSAFYINGTLFATIYANEEDIGTILMIADVPGTLPKTAVFYADEGLDKEIAKYNDNDPYNLGIKIGEYSNVYITMDPDTVKGTISAGTGLDLYIDGIKHEYGFDEPLTIGEHTVSIGVKAGYDGSNATITFNGQTITDGKIVITADMKEFTLVATGAVPASNGGSSSNDDSMGLTDYLLIILVVMVVILAIVVIMRMMRS